MPGDLLGRLLNATRRQFGSIRRPRECGSQVSDQRQCGKHGHDPPFKMIRNIQSVKRMSTPRGRGKGGAGKGRAGAFSGKPPR